MEVKVPQLPESVADATLVAWHRKVGEAVRRDENLVDLETDKVVLEVPAPANGVLKEIRINDGTTVTSGEVLAVIEPGEAPAQAASEPAGDAAESEATDSTAAESARGESKATQSAPAAASSAAPVAASNGGPSDASAPLRMGPAVRKLVEENALDPARISGSGRDGRLTKGDVLEYLADRSGSELGTGESHERAPVQSRPPEAPAASSLRREQRVQMTRLRQRIAERLVEAQQTAAMLTTFNEADMSEIVALRKKYQEQFQSRYDIKLGFMSFFVRAVVESLRAYPVLNASVDGNEIVYHEYFDIGVAVSTERGLLVPVLRDAHLMNMAEIESGIRDFGLRARNGEIGMEELTGGTFTITNGGIFGSMMSTPILNPPQSGILGMHAIQERAVVVDGEIAIRPMMYLALSYDHRIVDGREAVQFLVHVKQQLEDPARLVLQI
jgi:2-oxoglutarate dehydrogenase E2 component (dihydrolipoamide succinyltransferase)